MSIIALEKFTGFGYKGRTSDEFSVYSVSNGVGYDRNLFATFSDKEESVVGQDGEYYFGTDLKSRPLPLTLYLYDLTREDYIDLQRWLDPRGGMGDFYFYEEPYKYYTSVKPVSFGTYGQFARDILYSGEVAVEFKAYDPHGYAFANTVEDGDALGLPDGWETGTGILPQHYTIPTSFASLTDTSTIIKLYNGGNAYAKPIITINGSVNNLDITNLSNGDSFQINAMSSQEFVVDCKIGRITENNNLVVGRFSGNFIKLEPTEKPIAYTMTFSTASGIVTSVEDLPTNIVGREIVVYDGVDTLHYKIASRTNANEIILDDAYGGLSGEFVAYAIDVNEVVISGTDVNISVSFDYKYTYL